MDCQTRGGWKLKGRLLKLRTLLAGAAALAAVTTGTFASTAQAVDDPTYEADVGGGAAALVATVGVSSWNLYDLGQKDNALLTVVTPSVTMGKNGGSFRKQVLAQNVAGVQVTAAQVAVKGNRFGTPYAEASTKLVNVSVTGGTLKGTKLFGAIETYCRWDRAGWVASTTITDLNGDKFEPAPNTIIELPGLGQLYLNRQYLGYVPQLNADGSYQRDANGWPRYAETIFVMGAHLSTTLDSQNYDINDPDFDNVNDVYLGFTSCDPLQLPPLSGLKLTQSST